MYFLIVINYAPNKPYSKRVPTLDDKLWNISISSPSSALHGKNAHSPGAKIICESAAEPINTDILPVADALRM